ncbi:MAG: IS66 family insertion sequence element accessory protein TnpA [Lacipirellulaceae bacterium]
MAKVERDLEKERCWRELLARHASSGLSMRAFCRAERLTESLFYA